MMRILLQIDDTVLRKNLIKPELLYDEGQDTAFQCPASLCEASQKPRYNAVPSGGVVPFFRLYPLSRQRYVMSSELHQPASGIQQKK